MLELTLRIDMERIGQQLAQLPRHAQVGIAEALTRTALDARDAVRETPPQRFTLRRPWVAQGIGALPATPRRLVAVVYSRDRFMALQETGGEKTSKLAISVGRMAQIAKTQVISKSQ